MKNESSGARTALKKTKSSGAGAGAMFMKRRAPEPELWHFTRTYEDSGAALLQREVYHTVA